MELFSPHAGKYGPKQLWIRKLVTQCPIENNLIDSCGSMYSTVDSFIEINNIINGSNDITLKKVDGKPYGFGNMYMDKVDRR